VLRLVALLTILVIIMSLGACVREPVNLSEEDAGRTAELRAGDRLEVVLNGNPTTGYRWGVASVDPAVLRQFGEPEFKPDTKAIGSGGKVILRFEAAAPGQTVLQLIYHRTWEKGIPPVKTFEVTVVVK